MAVYIKKERLGSVPPQTKFKTTQVRFGVLREAIDKAQAEFQGRLKERHESNAEVQRWRTQMTRDERAKDAVERVIPTMKVAEESRLGRPVTDEQARTAVCERIAERHDRDKA